MINTYDLSVERPEYFKQLAVGDALMAYFKCPQEERNVDMYSHSNMINFTLNGKKLIHSRGKTWTLTRHMSVFIKKSAYNFERYHDEGWEPVVFYIPDSFLLKVFKEYRSYLPLKNLPPPPADMIIPIDVNAATLAFFYAMLPYFAQQPSPTPTLLELKFKELLYSILSNPANSELLAYVNSILDQHKPSLHEIMEANYTFNLSLAEYARIAQRSLATFKREFVETFRTTPGKWLTQKRLEYAKMLLDTSTKNVNEIAYESGFENVTHFSRVFREKYGLAPLRYRKVNTPSATQLID